MVAYKKIRVAFVKFIEIISNAFRLAVFYIDQTFSECKVGYEYQTG